MFGTEGPTRNHQVDARDESQSFDENGCNKDLEQWVDYAKLNQNRNDLN